MTVARTPYNSVRTLPADGRQIVAAAGTRQALLAGSMPVLTVDVTAETDNTGVIVVGADTVVAAQATRRGTPLDAGATWTAYNVDLKDIYLDATVNGDGVTFTYIRGGD